MIELFNLLLGIVIGSFLGMATYRLPKGESFINKSGCPVCHTTLAWRDLFPILSYLFLKGKCRYCKASISRRYLAIEFSTGFIFFLNSLIIPSQPLLILAQVTSVILICILVCDIETMYINDSFILILLICGVIYSFINYIPIFNTLILCSFSFLIIFIMSKLIKYASKKEVIGTADLKLFGVSGCFLTLNNLSTFYIMCGMIGIFLGLYYKDKKIGIYYPFAPAICIALYFCLLFGNQLDLNLISFLK